VPLALAFGSPRGIGKGRYGRPEKRRGLLCLASTGLIAPSTPSLSGKQATPRLSGREALEGL
jgi:hypothetical protein